LVDRSLLEAHKKTTYAEATLEDRCGERFKLRVPAKLRVRGGNAFAVELINLSISGFACESYSGVEAGTLCWITLPGLQSLEAEVVRNDGRTLGCAFRTLLNPAVLNRIIDNYMVSEDD